jgi:hypothetical protein
VHGRTHTCRLDPGPLASANQWLLYYQDFWNSRLNVLERLLTEEANTASQPAPKKGKTK